MNFVERINYLATKVFDSQSDLARQLDISKVTVNGYTSGKQKPNYDVLSKLYDLGYSIDWLLSGKGSMKRQFFNDSEADNYDNEVLIATYKDIGKKEFGLGSEWLLEAEGVSEVENTFKDFEKSLSIQRLIYREYSVKALKSKIIYSDIFKSLSYVIDNDSYKLVCKYIENSGKLVDLLTNPEANKDNNFTSLKLDPNYNKNNAEYDEPPITTNELYQRLSNALYLVKELAEYESYLFDFANETDKVYRVNNGTKNSKKKDHILDSETYSIGFESLKSYFKTQIDLVGNTDLISRKSKILTLAVMNNFKFID